MPPEAGLEDFPAPHYTSGPFLTFTPVSRLPQASSARKLHSRTTRRNSAENSFAAPRSDHCPLHFAVAVCRPNSGSGDGATLRLVGGLRAETADDSQQPSRRAGADRQSRHLHHSLLDRLHLLWQAAYPTDTRWV